MAVQVEPRIKKNKKIWRITFTQNLSCLSSGGGDTRNDRYDPDERRRSKEEAQRHTLGAADR